MSQIFCQKAVLRQIQRFFHYRPKLKHAVAAWSPWLESDTKCLEKFQERLMKMLSDVRNATYEDKLKDAWLTALKERRIRGDTIQTFKVLKGFNQVPKEKRFQLVADDARPTRMTATVEGGKVVRKEAVEVERARLETRRNFYSIRAAKEWNKLLETVKKLNVNKRVQKCV